MLEIPEFKKKISWVHCFFKADCCNRNQSVTKLNCFKESKYHDIFLIWAHMARNPYFPAGRKMCLMGDIKVRAYYSSWDNAHVSISINRILTHVSYETLDSHYKRILPFKIHKLKWVWFSKITCRDKIDYLSLKTPRTSILSIRSKIANSQPHFNWQSHFFFLQAIGPTGYKDSVTMTMHVLIPAIFWTWI